MSILTGTRGVIAVEQEENAGKKQGFLAGADISEFRDMRDEAMVRDRIAAAHAIVDRLEALTFPTIAVIHGYAMGGGLEGCCSVITSLDPHTVRRDLRTNDVGSRPPGC